jgi:copper oxidase (laccase) domain-containing protein
MGVPPQAIDVGGICTSCQVERFFSYRRCGGKTGQLAAFIVADYEPRSNTP